MGLNICYRLADKEMSIILISGTGWREGGGVADRRLSPKTVDIGFIKREYMLYKEYLCSFKLKV